MEDYTRESSGMLWQISNGSQFCYFIGAITPILQLSLYLWRVLPSNRNEPLYIEAYHVHFSSQRVSLLNHMTM